VLGKVAVEEASGDMKNTWQIGLCALAIGACVAAQAGTLSVTNIQCKTNLSQTNWVVLTNLVVAQSLCAFVDVSTPFVSARFYRVAGFTNITSLPPNGMVLIPAGSFTMGNCMNPQT